MRDRLWMLYLYRHQVAKIAILAIICTLLAAFLTGMFSLHDVLAEANSHNTNSGDSDPSAMTVIILLLIGVILALAIPWIGIPVLLLLIIGIFVA